MKSLSLWWILGTVAASLLDSPCLAGEPSQTIESILAKWEEASQKCRSLDVKFTALHYDDAEVPPKEKQGRFYYEAPNLGRCDIWKKGPAATNDWSNLSEVFVWTDKEVLQIQGERRTGMRLSSAQLQAHLSATAKGWPRWLQAAFFQLQNPQHCFPLTVDIRAADVRERFTLTLKEGGARIVLNARPKLPLEQAAYREVDVILDAKTYATRAIRTIPPKGRGSSVWVFEDPKINQRPSDREQLIHPDLQGLVLTD